jgi:hypothetical protein
MRSPLRCWGRAKRLVTSPFNDWDVLVLLRVARGFLFLLDRHRTHFAKELSSSVGFVIAHDTLKA